MIEPISFRNKIPFFYNKSEPEFRQDPYERYDPMVLRQSALHLADELWGAYPFESILQFAQAHFSQSPQTHIVELGCGVGRWIATLAKSYPNASCWGIDYSYQMLKRAKEVWIDGTEIYLNLATYGLTSSHRIEHSPRTNLKFGLSKAEALPFADQSQDIVLSSFLMDRLADPIQGWKEMRRILKPQGKIIFVMPLNFKRAEHWETFYPPLRLQQILEGLDLQIIDWQEDMVIKEPLDIRGNLISWKCVAGVCKLK